MASDKKVYRSLVSLFLDIVEGLSGTVVQGYDGNDHVYFVVGRFNLKRLQREHPGLRNISKLGTAQAGRFMAKIDWSKADMDVHEFTQQGVRCQNCGFAESLNFNSGVPADRANEIWEAFVKHQQGECRQVAFFTVR